jgi:hypothetical protein
MLDSSDSPSKKKKNSLSFKVSTFLLGHIAAWRSLSARVKLLSALEGVKEKEKANVVVQLVDEAISMGEAGRLTFAGSATDEEIQTYSKLLLQPYDAVTRKWLESDESSAFAVLLKSFELADTQGEFPVDIYIVELHIELSLIYRSRCLHPTRGASSYWNFSILSSQR